MPTLSVLCVVRVKKKKKHKIKKTMKKRKKRKEKKRPKVNLILSHVSHTFFILDPLIGPHTFRHTHCTLGKNVFFNVKKGPWFKVQFASNWSLNPCLKLPCCNHQMDQNKFKGSLRDSQNKKFKTNCQQF